MERKVTNRSPVIGELMQFGLTEIESRIYIQLLSTHPMTGYRIAAELKKPVANIYKSLNSLEAKGLVLVEEGVKKQYAPIKLEALLHLMEKRFARQKELIKTELSMIEKPFKSDRIFQIKSRVQLFEKVREMLGRAEQVILMDIFPDLLQEFKSEIEVLSSKNLKIHIKTYRSTAIEGADVIVDARGEAILSDYPGQWIKISIDGMEQLTGLISKDRQTLHHGIWTESSFLSLMNHFGMKSEMDLDRIVTRLRQRDDPELRQILKSYTSEAKYSLPGYQKLMKQLSKKGE